MSGIDYLIDTNILIYIIKGNPKIKQYAINIKQQIKMKFPDAIVAATAIKNNLSLVTADKDFKKVPNLDLVLIDMV